MTPLLWICRAGMDSIYYDRFISENRIYLPWLGYNVPLNTLSALIDFRYLVENEKQTTNRSSVSNWASQLYAFAKEMQPNDMVLIPAKCSRSYTLAKIISDYNFQESPNDLHHFRQITVLQAEILRSEFSQSVQYSLGAYRTIFKGNHEEEILTTIKLLQQQK